MLSFKTMRIALEHKLHCKLKRIHCQGDGSRTTRVHAAVGLEARTGNFHSPLDLIVKPSARATSSATALATCGSVVFGLDWPRSHMFNVEKFQKSSALSELPAIAGPNSIHWNTLYRQRCVDANSNKTLEHVV